ncbi:hypothetical protein R3P38DRAFT_2803518 [Favolaschia claudopus]|uniref:Uncharacterized protein n=1 Tax=Favolaschia claudopus TaxID=2862362 RepID=A0AAV9ZSE5_9AGAR
MPYCPCCGEPNLPRATKTRHLRAAGWKNIKNYVGKHGEQLTSRLLDRFHKRAQSRRDDSDGEDDRPSKIRRRDTTDSPSHPLLEPGEDPQDSGCEMPPVDDSAANIDDINGALRSVSQTTRPRLLSSDSESSSSEDDPDDEAAPPLTTVDIDELDETADPELEEELLRHVELNPYELLEGQLESEESQRSRGVS